MHCEEFEVLICTILQNVVYLNICLTNKWSILTNSEVCVAGSGCVDGDTGFESWPNLVVDTTAEDLNTKYNYRVVNVNTIFYVFLNNFSLEIPHMYSSSKL